MTTQVLILVSSGIVLDLSIGVMHGWLPERPVRLLLNLAYLLKDEVVFNLVPSIVYALP
jgi:hypothetical protein